MRCKTPISFDFSINYCNYFKLVYLVHITNKIQEKFLYLKCQTINSKVSIRLDRDYRYFQAINYSKNS